jgi:rhomboid protease GluP
MMETHEYWRFLTAMFLHYSLIHIALNMLSLFFIGSFIEALYGPWRYLLIYFATGIVGGITTYVLDPTSAVAGASGAIFGIFGAMGAFYFLNRQTLSRGAISQWLFWLVLNLVWGFSGGIAIWDHIGGLVAGLILGWVLLPKMGKRSL